MEELECRFYLLSYYFKSNQKYRRTLYMLLRWIKKISIRFLSMKVSKLRQNLLKQLRKIFTLRGSNKVLLNHKFENSLYIYVNSPYFL